MDPGTERKDTHSFSFCVSISLFLIVYLNRISKTTQQVFIIQQYYQHIRIVLTVYFSTESLVLC